MFVYLVREEWAKESENGHNIRIYKSFESALKTYSDAIELEKKEYFASTTIENDDVEFIEYGDSWSDDSKSYAIEQKTDILKKYENGEDISGYDGIVASFEWCEKGRYDMGHSEIILEKRKLTD